MAHELPPIRLSADPETSPLLRSLVDQARQNVPDAATLAQFTARVDAAIGTSAPTPTTDSSTALTASGAKSGLTVVGKAALVAIGVVVAGLAVVGVRQSTRIPKAATGQASIATAPAAAQLPTAAAEQPAAAQLPTAASRPVAIATAPIRTQAPTVSAALATPALPNAATPAHPLATNAPKANVEPDTSSNAQRPASRDSGSEATLLDAARAALTSDPKRALQLTQEHARRFPKGDLAQEREVIAIEALGRLGQTDVAQKRGSAFGKQYPGSVHQSKIEQSLKGRAP